MLADVYLLIVLIAGTADALTCTWFTNHQQVCPPVSQQIWQVPLEHLGVLTQCHTGNIPAIAAILRRVIRTFSNSLTSIVP